MMQPPQPEKLLPPLHVHNTAVAVEDDGDGSPCSSSRYTKRAKLEVMMMGRHHQSCSWSPQMTAEDSSREEGGGGAAAAVSTATKRPSAAYEEIQEEPSSAGAGGGDAKEEGGDGGGGGGGDDLLPDDFLEPLPVVLASLGSSHPPFKLLSLTTSTPPHPPPPPPRPNLSGCRQFWKAGDYDGEERSSSSLTTVAGGIDHVRVHPKFLHSNATSHKWALGAVAELLDNALDEVHNGATFVSVDMVQSPKDGGPMLIVEDDGGGMIPDSMRRCMSLGYSAKSKRANTIGQYGNGFKTSTMRLGSDVIVFSRTRASEGSCPTQSIGLLSYSFLRDTRQEDIIVPMIDYEIKPFGLMKLIRSSVEDWDCNLDTIIKWSPFLTEPDLLNQFSGMKSQGTKIVLFNLWEDDQGQLELDFESDPYDIQVRGANRDEKKIAMAQRFPNSRHYLTYRHSLRSYASILYLRLSEGFRIILRGKDVEHHNLVNDLMFTQEHTYKPHGGGDNIQKEAHMVAVVTVGFVKDAKDHVDVQGFNVYHKNRLIKPFWRVWNSSSSQGRGVIGVLEANFVEPAHDKQGFERTIVLGRLETRLLQLQKSYWMKNCHLIGYHNAKSKETSRTSYSKAVYSGGPRECRVLTRECVSQFSQSSFQIPGMSEANLAEKASSPSSSVGTRDGNIENQGCKCNCVHYCGSEDLLPSIDRNVISIQKFLEEVEKNKQLEAKVSDLEKEMSAIKSSMEIILRERDALRLQVQVKFQQCASENERQGVQLKGFITQD